MEMTELVQAQRGGKVLGFPLEGFGLFTSLLLSLASRFSPSSPLRVLPSLRCSVGTSSATTR